MSLSSLNIKSRFFIFMTILFWFVILYGGTSGVGYGGGYKGGFFLDYAIWVFLYKGRPVSNGYQGIELGVIFYSFFLFIFFRGKYYIDKRNFQMLALSCIVFIFILINPNNNATFLEYFLGNDSKFILLFPLLFSAICFLKTSTYIVFIKDFFKIGLWIVLFKSIISFAFFIAGNGIPLRLSSGFYMTTMPMSDYLQYLGFYVSLLTVMYLLYRKSKLLIIALFLYLVMVLSFRRTDSVAVAICLVLIFLFYSKYIGSLITLTRIFIFTVLIVTILFSITTLFTNIKISTVTYRMLAAFSYFDEDLENQEFKDSGHINQSVETTKTMISNLGRFWGSGLQNRAFYVEGQTVRPHNNIAYAWAKQGLVAALFIIFQFLWFILLLMNLFASQKKYCPEYKLFRFFVVFQLIMFLVTGWSSSRYIFQATPHDYIMITLLFSLLKIKNIHIKYVFN